MTNTAPAFSSDKIQTVLVIGGGQMGCGIAQVFAQADREVFIVDQSSEQLDRAKSVIAKSAERLLAKEKISAEQHAAVSNQISYFTGLDQIPSDQLEEVDLAVEAVTENVELKLAIFAELDAKLPAGAILASNTSSISITTIAAATKRPKLVVGMHFMNPVPVLRLVEVISGLETDSAATELVMQLSRDIGKTPVHSQDVPGFIANRILVPMINEAFFVLGEGIGTAEGIDDVMRLGMAHPMGPLQLADLVGLDTLLAICEILHRDLGEDKYRPAPLLRRYVAAGRYGRKVGIGVYEYNK